MFVGNGGSAGIASHAAIDYTKNGGLRALCFNDGAALTCYGNDLGFDQVRAGFIGNAVGALKVGIVGHRSSVEKPQLVKYITSLLK